MLHKIFLIFEGKIITFHTLSENQNDKIAYIWDLPNFKGASRFEPENFF